MNPPTQDHRAPSDPSRQKPPPIYPPPPQAIFPPSHGSNTENSSETSSSGSKRKRLVVDDGSDAGRSRTRASSTSDFNNNTKAQFQDAIRDGLIDFQEKHNLQNAIALCGTCHTNYDHLYNPSFFFLPTELDYFLNFERQDRRRRRRLGRRTGIIPARICPTAQTYQDHQIDQGIEGARLGGLYTRIVTYDFLSDYPGRRPFQPGLSEYGAAKSWTGSPMASLQRAIIMLRKLNLRGIPRNIRDALRQLQDAYSEELDLDGSDTSSQSSIEPSEPDHVLDQGAHPKHENERSQARTKSQQSEAEQGSAGGDADQVNDKDRLSTERIHQNDLESSDHPEAVSEVAFSRAKLCHHDIYRISELSSSSSRIWRWGPSATSNDAAKFYRLVI